MNPLGVLLVFVGLGLLILGVTGHYSSLFKAIEGTGAPKVAS